MRKLNLFLAAALLMFTLNIFAGNCPTLSGELVIGNSENADFYTITEAIEALQCGGVSSPVTFLIEKGTYHEKLIISSVPFASALNPVTFTSQSGINSDVIVSYGNSNATLSISASYISFENITIDHKLATYGNCMRVDGKAGNLNFSGVVFDGVETGAKGNDNAVVFFTNTAPKYDISFKECEINNGSIGISKAGMNSEIPDRKTTISGTLFFNQTESGLVLGDEDSPVITDNVVSAVSTQKGYKAIYLNNASNGVIVSKNVINIANGSAGLLMHNCLAQAAKPGQINNNTVSVGGSSDALGISLTGSSDYQMLNFNRVKLKVSNANASSQAYFKNAGNGKHIAMLNNIFMDLNSGNYAVVGNSYKDFAMQLNAQANPSVSASAEGLTMQKLSPVK